MDEKTYERWWQLHLRVAKGETLLAEEKVEYETGSALMDQEEAETLKPNTLRMLQTFKVRIQELENEHRDLVRQNKKLDQKIKRLEKAYQASTGHVFTPDSHA